MKSRTNRVTLDGPPPFKRPRISDITTTKQQKKRGTKSTSKAIRGKRSSGKLSKFTSLPLDAIFEIVSRLEPLDLVHLSHVSKSFRKLLNPSVNHHLWAAARKNIPGLPECPRDLNEGQYASLMFGNRCQACDSLCKFESVEYAIRCRLCQSCHKELIRKGNVVIRDVAALPLREIEEICTLLPRSIQVFNGTTFAGDGKSATTNYDNNLNMPWGEYFSPELKLITKQYVALRKKPEELAAFVSERSKVAQEMIQSGIKMQEWASQFALDRRLDKLNQISARAEHIQERLKALGWDQDDFPSAEYVEEPFAEWENHLSQPRALTERSWKILEPKLVEILETVKELRKQRLINSRMRTRALELGLVWPRFIAEYASDYKYDMPGSVLGQLSTITQLIAEDEANIPITLERLSERVDDILVEFTERMAELENVFTQMIEEPADGSEDPTVAPADRAISIFTCTVCGYGRCSMYLEQVFQHKHTDDDGWQVDAFEFFTEAKDLAEKALAAMKLSLESSREDVQELDGRISCRCGNPEVPKRLNFLDLVAHLYRENSWFSDINESWDPTCKDEVLNDHDVSCFRSLIQVYHDTNFVHGTRERNELEYMCRACYAGGQARTLLETEEFAIYHLRAKHGLEFKNKNVLFDDSYGSFLLFFLHSMGMSSDNLVSMDSDSDPDDGDN